MRISELARASGLTVPTIKYYLREGLLPPGRATARTQAEYGPEHLDRLRLVRALVDVGRLPLATVQAVLRTLDQAQDSPEGLGPRELGDVIATVYEALPPRRGRSGAPVDDAPAGSAVTRSTGTGPVDDAGVPHRARAAMQTLGWTIDPQSATLQNLETALESVAAVGLSPTDATLRVYGQAALDVARCDVGTMQTADPARSGGGAAPGDVLRHIVVGTVLYEPVLTALRRLAIQQVYISQHPAEF